MKVKGRRHSSITQGLGAVAALLAATVIYPIATSTPVLSNPVSLSHGRPEPALPALAVGFQRGHETGLPVPRFVSLKSRQARLRVGPSLDYATGWIYTAKGLPMEIIEEYGHWRRVRDYAGTAGWMYGALLSGRRTGVIGPWMKTKAALRTRPDTSANETAALEARVRLTITSCDGSWCQVRLQKHDLSGYVRQIEIWGVYPGEIVE
jgi:SH3-like domain-containing protein